MKKRAQIHILFLKIIFLNKERITEKDTESLVLNFYGEINSAITLSWTAS